MNYRTFIVFLISFFAVFFGNIIYTLSCGPTPDPYDYYVSFFNPYAKGGGYEPFYYSALTPFYGDATPSEESANVADWQNYTGSKVTEKDIREYIYTYPVALFSDIATGSNALPDSVKMNTFAQFLGREKNREAARYLLFAKSCEPATGVEDRWSAPERDNALLSDLYKEGKDLYDKTSDKQIRARYAFQLVRLQHYSKEYQQAVTSFDQLFGAKENSTLVYYKALALKAGALLHLEDSVQSAYLFSRVFENAPSLRTSCFTSLMWSNTSAQQVYPLCKNNHEKAMAAAIYGFANAEPDIAALKQAYAFDPASPALNVLLGREINKLEDNYFSLRFGSAMTAGPFSIHDYAPGEDAQQLTVLKTLQTVVDSLIQLGKLKDMDLWRVSSAYLYYIQKDYPAAGKRLAEVKTKDPEVKDQWEIVNLLVNINQQQKIDSAFETRLLTSFKWLDTKTKLPANYHGYWEEGYDQTYFFNKIYRNLLFAILAPRYHQQGEEWKEALIRGRCDSLKMNDYFISGTTAVSQISNDMTSSALIRFNEFLHRPVKTPYEAYLAGFFPKEINMDQTIGVSFMRVHDFNSARSWFKKAAPGALAGSYLVFQDQLQDFGEDTATTVYNKEITQLQFCERMVQLQEKMKKAPVPAKVYYDYASALFSISYYGKTWYFVKDYRPTTEWYSASCDKDAFEKQYYGCYAAESYYLKAAQASTDREFRARCAFMAARCSQKHTARGDDYDKYVTALIHNRYFPLLTGNFAQTKFYGEVYQQCSYLRDYVKSTRKK